MTLPGLVARARADRLGGCEAYDERCLPQSSLSRVLRPCHAVLPGPAWCRPSACGFSEAITSSTLRSGGRRRLQEVEVTEPRNARIRSPSPHRQSPSVLPESRSAPAPARDDNGTPPRPPSLGVTPPPPRRSRGPGRNLASIRPADPQGSPSPGPRYTSFASTPLHRRNTARLSVVIFGFFFWGGGDVLVARGRQGGANALGSSRMKSKGAFG
jgi:hypothetical protein